jgi:hybrid polyketide synthase/nonribosomal peptide synthetase ACE1
MAFRTLDIEKDVVDQGFPEQSFDLIIASLVLHATSKLTETMKNVRRLLRPGGYLIMLELTDNDPMRFGFIFGSLPGWWLGVEDGRRLSPCIEPPKWGDLLENNGFSGLDLVKPNKSSEPLPLCVMLSQAVDDRVHFLRAPLSSPEDNVDIRELTIIGGSTAKTADYVSSLLRNLKPYCGDIHKVRSLPDLRAADISIGGSIIYLQDYDDPLFNSLSETKLKGLQTLFEKSKTILWITRGLKACVPHAKMAVGFVRCILQEMRHVRVQFLDIDPCADLDIRHTAETFLRLVASDSWAEQGQLKSLLWSLEPEIVYENSKEFIPRVRLSKTLNNRYNSARRAITTEVSPASQSITLTTSGNAPVLSFSSGLVSHGPVDVNDDQVILVSHSMYQAVAVGSLGHFFLVLGNVKSTGDSVIALSTTLSSRVSVNPSWVRPCPFPTKQAIDYLVSMFYALIAGSVLEDLSGCDTVVVLEPSEQLAEALERSAFKRGIQLRYITSAPSATKKTLWTTLHPRASRREVIASLPGKVSRVLSWGHNIWNAAVGEYLGAGTPIETLESLTSDHAYINKADLAIRVSDTLDACRTQILSHHATANSEDISVVPLHEIPASKHLHPLAVIDWSASASVPVTLEPVDSRPLFRQDKTYWLVGLTGGLGLSLCKWMVARGARYIVISSRNPKVDPRWISDLAAAGATLKVCSRCVSVFYPIFRRPY